MTEDSELKFWQNEADYWSDRAAKLEILVRFVLEKRTVNKQFLIEAQNVLNEERPPTTPPPPSPL